jgi:hypothetical protein
MFEISVEIAGITPEEILAIAPWEYDILLAILGILTVPAVLRQIFFFFIRR